MPISEQTFDEFEAFKAGTADPDVAARIGAKLDDPDSDLSRWFGERHDALKARKRRRDAGDSGADSPCLVLEASGGQS